jgi:ubiquinone/menaquinone biosynthesis C-methylase UbiE
MNQTRDYFDSTADRYWHDMYTTVPSNRHALLLQRRRKIVVDLTEGFGGKTLELGCGPGVFSSELPKARPYIVADLSESMVRLARDRAKERVAGGLRLSADKLPFTDKSFELVIAIGLIEYLPDLTATLTEIHRILRTGGVAIISFPSPRPWEKLLRWLGKPVESILRSFSGLVLSAEDAGAQRIFHRCYSASRIKQSITSIGFTVERNFHFHYFYFPFDAICFQPSKRIDQLLERFATTAPFLRAFAQTHVWRVRKLPLK